jgi:hypothetical protein
MIRSVVVIKARDGHDSGRMAEILAQLEEMDVPGRIGFWTGFDLGLRAGNWDYSIVADLESAEAYRAYDADPEHNRLRAELTPLVEQIVRSQIEI